ncbi:condensation domain-containing protein, partial [Alicyclobacillus fodiniaquatilis]
MAPVTELEKRLVSIWEEVLGIDHVGVNDSFFDLGGDSILGIQVVSKARESGLSISVRKIFEYPTISELALVTEFLQDGFMQDRLVTGKVSLLPIQKWFFEQEFASYNHWNQSVLLSLIAPINKDWLRTAIGYLLVHHDALRLRFTQINGNWESSYTDIESQDIPFEEANLSALSKSDQQQAIEREVERAQKSVNITHGPLIRLVYFDLGESKKPQLLWVIHHLVVDGVSWRILLEDLQKAYEDLSRNEPIRLPKKTVSVQIWTERLIEYSVSDKFKEERDFWLSQSKEIESRLIDVPIDYPEGTNREGDVSGITVTLDAEKTRSLLMNIPKTHRVHIHEVMLAALLQVVCNWTGQQDLLVDLEGHGREEILGSLDVSRTVGWFTSVYPLLVRNEEKQDLGDILRVVKEQVRRVPNRGIGYGVLRYLSNYLTSENGTKRASIGFNYLGQFDQIVSRKSMFREGTESSGYSRDERATRRHVLDVNAMIVDSELRVTWLYSKSLHSPNTIQMVANRYMESLVEFIDYCANPNTCIYTPSDFPLARLNQAEVDEVVGKDQSIEDIYRLTPLQAGMLFHALYDNNSGNYVIQNTGELSKSANIRALIRAYRQVMNQYDIFKSEFKWEGLREPHQLVKKQARIVVEEYDWTDMCKGIQHEMWEKFIQEDRVRGFELDKGISSRLSIIWTGEIYRIIWCHHHILLDGWSTSRVLKEVFEYYIAYSKGDVPKRDKSRSYREYISWLNNRSVESTEKFWREKLQGFTSPTPLEWGQLYRKVNVIEDSGVSERQLSGELTERLEKWAHQNQLTVNTLILGAWALVFSRYSREADILFGVTISGRPSDLQGVESMVGLFINTVPMRVQVDDEPIKDWFKRIQENQLECQENGYSSLINIQEWSEIPQGTPLFESLYIFENYLTSEANEDLGAELRISEERVIEQTHYPLNMIVLPNQVLTLKMAYNPERFSNFIIESMLYSMEIILGNIIKQEHAKISELSMLRETERLQVLVEFNDTGKEYEKDKTIHELFEEQVERTPEAVA